MLRNSSDNKKTVRDTMRSLPGDIWSLDRMSYYGIYDNTVMPDGLLLDKFQDYFETMLIEIALDEKYHYSPSLFAHDYYGVAALDFLVLYFAEMTTLFDFNTETIKVLPMNAMTELNEMMVRYQDDIAESKANPKNYDSEYNKSRNIRGDR